jgi:hypothetical protein
MGFLSRSANGCEELCRLTALVPRPQRCPLCAPPRRAPQLRSDAGRSALTVQGKTAPRVTADWIDGIAAGQRMVWSALEEAWFCR